MVRIIKAIMGVRLVPFTEGLTVSRALAFVFGEDGAADELENNKSFAARGGLRFEVSGDYALQDDDQLFIQTYLGLGRYK